MLSYQNYKRFKRFSNNPTENTLTQTIYLLNPTKYPWRNLTGTPTLSQSLFSHEVQVSRQSCYITSWLVKEAKVHTRSKYIHSLSEN